MSYLNQQKIKRITPVLDSSFSSQAIYSNLVALSGCTVVDYEPPSGSSVVIYEASIQISWHPDAQGSYLNSRLQTYSSGAWSTVSNTSLMVGAWSGLFDENYYTYFIRHQIPSWTGARSLRLFARSYNQAVDFTFGRSLDADGTVGSGARPHILVYAI